MIASIFTLHNICKLTNTQLLQQIQWIVWVVYKTQELLNLFDFESNVNRRKYVYQFDY